MALLFLESCEIGFKRWITEGNVDSVDDGLISKKAFTIAADSERFKNKIIRQFRDSEEHYEQRRFRLSFWIKTNGNLTQDIEFISVYSKKENQGGMIGLDKTGKFYVGYLCKDNEWNGKYVETNINQPSVTDGKYHFVEFDIVWDNSLSAHIIVYVDNKMYLKKLGPGLFDDAHCWSRPDSIMFGNLIGADVFLDDIIMWDDIGKDYVGPKGPKRITFKMPQAFSEITATENKEYLYEVPISNLTRAGIVTAIANEQAGSKSNVSVIFKTDDGRVVSQSNEVLSETDNMMSLTIGPQNQFKAWIGFEKK